MTYAPIGHNAAHIVMEKCGMKYYKDGVGHGVKGKSYRIKNNK